MTHRRTVTSYVVPGAAGKMPWGPARVFGLVAVPLMAGLIAVAAPWAVDHIEDRLVAETEDALAEAGIDSSGLVISFDYRDGVVSGSLPAGATADMVESAVDHPLLSELDVTATGPPIPVELGETDVSVEMLGGEMTLVGSVLTESQRLSLVEAAEAVVGTDRVDDRLVVSGLAAAVGGAELRVADLATAMAALAGADRATIALSDATLVVAAIANDPRVAAGVEQLETSITSVTPSVTIETTLAPVEDEIAQLQSELDGMAEEIRENVVFEPESYQLSSEAEATLDKVVAAMNRYPQPVVEISGHTDDRGDPNYNLGLSENRAAAVEVYLAAQGVPAEQLRSRGAGDTEPVASNDSAAGRAENRRVELVALEGF